MNHVYQLEDARLQNPSVVSIGVFDGVHRGHQALIKRLVTEARQQNRQTVVLTFFPHPDVVLKKITDPYYLTTPEQRAELFLEMGVDCVVTHPFDNSVRQMRAAGFVDNLLTHLNMKSLWVGADFALGYQREGNVTFLREQGRQKDFNVEALQPIAIDGEIINSTAIRQMLQSGAVSTVRRWLGRGYEVRGEVVRGDQRGRQIGFPTANLSLWQEQIIPSNGVYAGYARLQGETFPAVTNVGIRPTFAGDDVTVEVHLLDFNRDIYGEELAFTFETRLRDERKFNGIAEIRQQLERDVANGRIFLEKQKI